MTEIVLYIACSLDGYIAREDHGIDWLDAVDVPGEDYGYAAFYDSVDALLVGSRSLDAIGGAWPYQGKPGWLFSRRDIPAPHADVTVTRQEPREVVAELAARGVRRAWLIGGGELIASFRAAGLVSEYIVFVLPVLLGSGIPLFPRGQPDERLRLTHTHAYASGLVELRYLPAEASDAA